MKKKEKVEKYDSLEDYAKAHLYDLKLDGLIMIINSKYHYSNELLAEVEERINGILEWETKETILSAKEELKGKINLKEIDRYLNRFEALTDERIDNLDKVDIKYYLSEHYYLSVFQFIKIIKNMKKYDFTKEEYDNAYESLIEMINDKKNARLLDSIKKEIDNCGLDNSYINNLLNLRKKIEKKEEKLRKKELLKKTKTKKASKELIKLSTAIPFAIISGMFEGLLGSSKKSTFKSYEPYQFEEEDLEEDDFHYDDLD